MASGTGSSGPRNEESAKTGDGEKEGVVGLNFPKRKIELPQRVARFLHSCAQLVIL